MSIDSYLVASHFDLVVLVTSYTHSYEFAAEPSHASQLAQVGVFVLEVSGHNAFLCGQEEGVHVSLVVHASRLNCRLQISEYPTHTPDPQPTGQGLNHSLPRVLQQLHAVFAGDLRRLVYGQDSCLDAERDPLVLLVLSVEVPHPLGARGAPVGYESVHYRGVLRDSVLTGH